MEQGSPIPVAGLPAAGPGGAPAIPRPGQIFDPVGRALDRIGDRWTLVLVRHLLGAPRGFQELRERTGIAPRVLSARLRQLAAEGFVEPVRENGRPLYALTAQGRTLEPIVAAIARWWVLHAMEAHVAEAGGFTSTSARSILESLPFLLREERADVERTFEVRLTGPGGGVWTVRIDHRRCTVSPGFAERADVRYTAEARVWCAVALGLLDARDAVKRGFLTKDGGPDALDRYFHQIARPSGAESPATVPRAGGPGRPARHPKRERSPK
jgi:DNA-binding HxlR family transcriptional regulator